MEIIIDFVVVIVVGFVVATVLLPLLVLDNLSWKKKERVVWTSLTSNKNGLDGTSTVESAQDTVKERDMCIVIIYRLFQRVRAIQSNSL